jgi:hypothetical protein
MHAYGKHDLHLGPASLPPDHTWGHGLPSVSPNKAQGQRSIQIDGLRVPCVSHQTAGHQHGLVFFGAGDISKGGSDIIGCLPRAHRASEPRSAWNCSIEPTPDRPRIQVGSPYSGGHGRPSQPRKRRRRVARSSLARLQTGRHWLSVAAKRNGASRISGRVRWRWDD